MPRPSSPPSAVLLARADLPSVEPEEVIALLLAGSATGRLPQLEWGARRDRAMPGGGDQTRIDVRYSVSRRLTYHGAILVATRPQPPAGVLVVLGDDTLTAGTVDALLDSARWRS